MTLHSDEDAVISNGKGAIILYQTQDGQPGIEVSLVNDTVWLTADQMAALFQRNKSTISRHIKAVYESGELSPDSTVAFFATVQQEGRRKVVRDVAYYNLDAIISVGYRVKSHRGVQFRIWATKILKEYLTKGFALNDELLKQAGGGNYFDELLARIRDIRSSEKVFYRKVLEIYALSIDYAPRTETTQRFFKTVQKKCTSLRTVIPPQKLSIPGQMLKKISWGSPHGLALFPEKEMLSTLKTISMRMSWIL